MSFKKVIDGKLYNTETAELIAESWNGLDRGDFNNRSEYVYVTKKGAFFVHGIGGAMTEYGRPCEGNSRCGGETILALTESEAVEMLERMNETEALEKHFSHVISEA